MPKKNKKMDVQTVLILLLIGLMAGVLSGLIGIGGGIIIVPALVYFIGFSQRTAQGTSLAILLLPIGLLGVIQFYKAGDLIFIPSKVKHSAKIISNEPMFAVVQRQLLAQG